MFEGIVVEDSTTLKPRPNVPPVKLTVEVEKKPSPVTFGPYMGADLACDSKDPKISCKVTLSDDATAALSAMNGAVFELRGKTITIKDHAIEKVPFTQLDPFYAATLEAVFEGKAAPVVKEKVAVGLPGGQRLEGEIEVGFLKARALIAGKLVEAASSGKPFLFPGEAQGAAGQARHAVAVVNGYKLFGKRDAKVSELDLVGFLTDGPKRSQSCGNYTNKSTGEVKEIFYELRDKKVTLVDRRTGQVFRETLIKTPSQTCAKKEASAGFKYTAEPPPATIVAWIEAQLR